MDSDDSVNSIVSFLNFTGINVNILFFILLTFILITKNITKLLYKIFLLEITLLIISILFSKFIDYKWLINFTGFFLIQFLFSNYISTLKENDFNDFIKKFKFIIISLMLIISLVQILAIITNLKDIIINMSTLYFNANVGMLTENFNV